MELDFGIGGKDTDRVHVRHRTGVVSRADGVKLFVMSDDRKVIFEYLFTGLTDSSPPDINFTIPMRVPSSPTTKGVLVRYIRLTRTIGREYVVCVNLEAHCGDLAMTYLFGGWVSNNRIHFIA